MNRKGRHIDLPFCLISQDMSGKKTANTQNTCSLPNMGCFFSALRRRHSSVRKVSNYRQGLKGEKSDAAVTQLESSESPPLFFLLLTCMHGLIPPLSPLKISRKEEEERVYCNPFQGNICALLLRDAYSKLTEVAFYLFCDCCAVQWDGHSWRRRGRQRRADDEC